MCCLSEGAAACPGSKVELSAAIRRDPVPVRSIGGQVRIRLHADDLVIFDGHQQVARHDRLSGRLEAHLELDHYPGALIRRPGALPGATALERARAAAGPRVNNLRRERT
ncbi:Mu transposase domain-containing protein [Kocuria nitroreducens]|uniref:Mu transposase domain-containing protein n=1 Tax=Kocuria nitroreducens TaxID=3058914 RepID=UPI0036DD1C70